MSKNSKIFILGLPRTGTTSICATMLELGYSVAHTAYTQTTFNHADVIADTPIYNDYALLDRYYPNSQFIYLTRKPEKWLPSIKQLLLRMYNNVIREDGGFNTIIKRCFTDVFSPFTLENINNDAFLLACYNQHKARVTSYFLAKNRAILFIDISESASYDQLINFINCEEKQGNFPQLNQGGKVTAWKDIKHTKKVESTKNGRISTLDHMNENMNENITDTIGKT